VLGIGGRSVSEHEAEFLERLDMALGVGPGAQD
jgi:hypothetical protein